MIREINENDLTMLRILSEKDVFLARILSTYNAYSATDLAQFWVQVQEDNLNVVMSKIDNVLTLAYISDGNQDELDGFLYAVSASRMLCSSTFASKIGSIEKAETGPILLLEHREQQPCDFEYTLNPSLKEVHEVMTKCQSPGFQVPAWEPFYLDMSHRIRHQCALAVGIRNDTGKYCAVGFTTTQTNDTAVLSGICTLEKYRHKGHGSDIIRALLAQLSQQHVYVFVHDNEKKPFYDHMGFTQSGTWAEVSI